MKKVLIIQALAKQYRVPFFEQLYLALREEEIQLKVAYGSPNSTELKKADNVHLNPEYGTKVKNWWLLNDRFLYQSVLHKVASADLIIVEQASKHFINYILILLSALSLKKVAFWGHGRNRQAKAKSFSEWVKRALIDKVDWWFAYTKGTADYLAASGVDKSRITIIQNSIDTKSFRTELFKITHGDLIFARQKIGITESSRVALFCGGLYADKHLEFLILSAKLVKSKVANFELIIVGNGPERYVIEAAAVNESWLHYVGPKFGFEKAQYFKIADVFLMPGLVGLAILDAFVAGLPLITTDIPIHSPEIEYLHHGVNGMMTCHNYEAYASAVAELLTNQLLLLNLRKGAIDSADHYTLDNMVERSKLGIIECLMK